MWELWVAGKNEKPPMVDPLSRLSVEGKEYVLKICRADFRPIEFRPTGRWRFELVIANIPRLASVKYFKDIGFNMDQIVVLIGMMFNMVGRKDIQD